MTTNANKEMGCQASVEPLKVSNSYSLLIVIFSCDIKHTFHIHYDIFLPTWEVWWEDWYFFPSRKKLFLFPFFMDETGNPKGT